MTIKQSALKTYQLLKATADVAEKSLEGRIQHYRAHLKSEEKELRTYSWNYCPIRTIQKAN